MDRRLHFKDLAFCAVTLHVFSVFNVQANESEVGLLSVANGPSMRVCRSSSVPKPDYYWVVSEKQAHSIDKRLRQHIELLNKEYFEDEILIFKGHYRQYIGLKYGAESAYFINVFPKSKRGKSRDKNTPYFACHGVEKYWGIIYSPKDQEFGVPILSDAYLNRKSK